MSTAKLFVPHGMLFLLDPGNASLEIPQYASGQICASNPSCVSVATQAPVDGESDVSLIVGQLAPDNMRKCFGGSINTPSMDIAVCTSDNKVILRQNITTVSTQVSVWVDEPLPSKIVIVVHGEPRGSIV